MADIEKIAQDRYRLRAHGQLITVSAGDLLDVMDWALRHAEQLRAEDEAEQDDEQEVPHE